ncbi:MAG: DUF3105 domain-containing protein [Actinomycetota bacterium]|nr:DUF3105 domain-containing protein [Actinomycetota bacterium]
MGGRRSAQSRQAGSSGGGSRRAYIIVGLIAAVFLGGFAALVIVDARQKAASGPPGGVESYEGLSRDHVPGNVNYEQSPPVGGPHNDIWQNCGFYEEPIRDENAVHSLEHGAVWITYSPDLPQDEIEGLRDLAQSNDYVLVSPYPDLDSPVVASAWGKQLSLESAEDPDLERFIGAYTQGPQTPEPGAACTGGIGDPA